MELRSCPFCGSQPITPWEVGWRGNLSRVMWTGCANGHRMIALPVDEWNTRANAAEIEKLRADLATAVEAFDCVSKHLLGEADKDPYTPRWHALRYSAKKIEDALAKIKGQ